MTEEEKDIVKRFYELIGHKDYPCVAAREAASRKNISCFVAKNMTCPVSDNDILKFLYDFVDRYREEGNLYHSVAIIFPTPVILDEAVFEELMWIRLQALSNMDALQYKYDRRVMPDPASGEFSFSLKEEAFFIIGLHSCNSRMARQFPYPTLIFNPHAQFETMKKDGQYNKIQNITRKRDIALSGSVNPMLNDFGESSEVLQYSGKQYPSDWKCPLKINHGST